MQKGYKVQVLDSGSVELIDWMGDDSDIVKAARISTGASVKSQEEDARLIDYLVEHEHTSPFEMCEIKLKLSMPIFIARQWMRHRMASINEYSGRYSEMKDEFYVPKEFRTQSTSNHQGSDGKVSQELSGILQNKTMELYRDSFVQYQSMIDHGVSREMSRIILPLSTYTSFFWKIDLHNLLKFIRLRIDPTAQEEIRVYADELWKIVKMWVPLTAKSFENHYLKSVKLSGEEINTIRQLFSNSTIIKQVMISGIKALSIKKRQKDKLLHILTGSSSSSGTN